MRTIYECNCEAECGGIVVEVHGELYFASLVAEMQKIVSVSDVSINDSYSVDPQGMGIVKKAFESLRHNSKNQIVEITMTVWLSTNPVQYEFCFTRKNGRKSYRKTTNHSSVAIDILDDVVNNPHWIRHVEFSLKVYPVTIFKFHDNTGR